MRTLIAGLGVVLASAGTMPEAADAQRGFRGAGAGYPVPARGPAMRPGGGHAIPGGQWRQGQWQQGRHGGTWNGRRWQTRDGRWVGGWNAPGGWAGYRQPFVGWQLPGYWVQPNFVVNDWSWYGLAQPQPGYSWTRYYDDAVLIDEQGSVYDAVPGVAWDRYPDGYADGFAGNYAPPPGAPGAYDYAPAPVYEGERRSSGLGGAAIGAVAGGVAGNLIAGRGNRLGGTLIGAGVGGAAGYAIDRSRNRGRVGPGAGYAPHPGYAPAPGGWVSPDGRTTVTTAAAGGGQWGGYGSTTTVVVQSAPVVTTTTTTEYYDDVVTYRKPAVRKVWRKPVKTKTICRC